MIDKLIYSVAKLTFCICTPDKEKTSAIMQNYLPFKVENCTPKNLLFQLNGSEAIALPETTPDDILQWKDIYYYIYRTPQGVIVSMKTSQQEARFFASRNWKEIKSSLTLTNQEEKVFLNSFLRLAFGMTSTTDHQTIKLHASVIELNGKALAFMGTSGTGKSTHSKLWHEFIPGCTLLNDDEPLVRILEDGSIRVYGAPWSGSTPCYRSASAELVAFVHLYQHSENKLTKLNYLQALSSIYGSSAMLRSDMTHRNAVLNVVTDILQTVPVYRLDCRPDKEAVLCTRSLLPE